MRLIDGDALTSSIEPIIEAEEQIYGRASWNFAAKCRNIIEDALTIEPKHKKGKWIHHEGGYSDHYECTACSNAIVLTERWNYCPNCGARMEGCDD